ncbi:MAG: GNAT family N-acetyltransferase [Promethearchaeota archaeon]
METEFEIRMAMPDDKGEIERLTRKIVVERNEEYIEKRFEWGILRRIYDPLQKHGICIAALKNTGKNASNEVKLGGMIFGELRIDPFGLSEYYLKLIYVEPEFWNQSLRKKMLKAIIEHLKKLNIKKIKMNLNLDSVKTKALLSEFNFEPKYMVLELKLEE